MTALPDLGVRHVMLPDGRRLAYAEHGVSSGYPVVYCHGVPSCGVEAELIVNSDTASSLNLRVIVPDRPGVGRSDFQPHRRILDWPDDVLALSNALHLDTFAVFGSSGGAAYALACGFRSPDRVRVVGVLGGVAPLTAPGMLKAMSPPLRIMFRLARSAPQLLRGLFRLQLRAIRKAGPRSNERMVAWAPEPDRKFLQRPEVRDAFMRCFQRACQPGTRGAALDAALIATEWGFDPSELKVPVLVWHGEQDRNVPVASGRYFARMIPNCHSIFYEHEAHLSVPLNQQEDILRALAAACARP